MSLDIKKFHQILIQKSIIKTDDMLSCIPIESSFSRKDYSLMERYKVEVNGADKFFLRISSDLQSLYSKYKLFASYFHGLAPEIILFYREDEKDYLLEEFILGETLESLIKKNPEQEQTYVLQAMKLHDELNQKLMQSTYEDACLEVKKLIKEIISFDFVTSSDAIIIEFIIQPEILILLAKRSSFQKRVSQGDFIDRNIIFTENKTLRVIDLEFTSMTHFYHDEIIRFHIHSPLLQNRNYDKKYIDVFDEIFSRLNQAKLMSQVVKSHITPPHVDVLFNEILILIRTDSKNFHESRLIKFLNGDFFNLTSEIAAKDKKILETEQAMHSLSNDFSLLSEKHNDLSEKHNILLNNYTGIINSYSFKLGATILWPIKKLIYFF